MSHEPYNFRAALGAGPIQPHFAPEPVSVHPLEALDAFPHLAAAAVYRASTSALDDVATSLATNAALHPDAHVAKYTVACLDAAHADREARHLYLAAAAFLGAWWAGAAA